MMTYCYNALYRFTLYFMTLDTGLNFGKISTPTQLGDPEMKVIDIELILKLLFIIMLIEHSCMMFSFYSASQPLLPLSSPNIGTFKRRSHFDNACMMGKHELRQAMLSGDRSCTFTAHKTRESACRSPS